MYGLLRQGGLYACPYVAEHKLDGSEEFRKQKKQLWEDNAEQINELRLWREQFKIGQISRVDYAIAHVIDVESRLPGWRSFLEEKRDAGELEVLIPYLARMSRKMITEFDNKPDGDTADFRMKLRSFLSRLNLGPKEKIEGMLEGVRTHAINIVDEFRIFSKGVKSVHNYAEFWKKRAEEYEHMNGFELLDNIAEAYVPEWYFVANWSNEDYRLLSSPPEELADLLERWKEKEEAFVRLSLHSSLHENIINADLKRMLKSLFPFYLHKVKRSLEAEIMTYLSSEADCFKKGREEQNYLWISLLNILYHGDDCKIVDESIDVLEQIVELD